MTEPTDQARSLVRRAEQGRLSGDEQKDLVALLLVAHARAVDTEASAEQYRRDHERVEREANALACMVADLMDGRHPDEVVDDLPHDARRRVIAYRHQSMGGLIGMARPSDQFGPLPRVPPRAAVMRERVRTYDPTEEGTTDART